VKAEEQGSENEQWDYKEKLQYEQHYGSCGRSKVAAVKLVAKQNKEINQTHKKRNYDKFNFTSKKENEKF